jgi:hypothetical protein
MHLQSELETYDMNSLFCWKNSLIMHLLTSSIAFWGVILNADTCLIRVFLACFRCCHRNFSTAVNFMGFKLTLFMQNVTAIVLHFTCLIDLASFNILNISVFESHSDNLDTFLFMREASSVYDLSNFPLSLNFLLVALFQFSSSYSTTFN